MSPRNQRRQPLLLAFGLNILMLFVIVATNPAARSILIALSASIIALVALYRYFEEKE